MKKGLAILFAGAIIILQYVYWISAFDIATRFIIDANGPHWISCCGGSLFPWPTEPSGFEVLMPVWGLDALVYWMLYSGLFVVVALCITFAAGYIGWRIGRYYEKRGGEVKEYSEEFAERDIELELDLELKKACLEYIELKKKGYKDRWWQRG